MDLAAAFEKIAQSTVREQNNERNLKACLAHARPLLEVLAKIKAIAPTGAVEGEHFYFTDKFYPHSACNGSLSLQVGFVDDGGREWIKLPGEHDTFRKGPVKYVDFNINPDGSAFAVRQDQVKPDPKAMFGYLGTLIEVSNVIELLPILASWVEDNMPYAVEPLIPKPYLSTGGHGIEM